MAKRIMYVDKTMGHLEHITHLGTETSRYTKRGLIRRMDEGKQYYTYEDGERAYLEVVRPKARDPYVRTQPDSMTEDNLLSLPKCPSGLKQKKD